MILFVCHYNVRIIHQDPHIAKTSYDLHIADRYMEFIPELTGEIFDYICSNVLVEIGMVYVIGTDSRQLAHMTHFIHHVWPNTQLLLFTSSADVEYIQTEADHNFYTGNLGSIDGEIAYDWYKGEYHRSSNDIFEEKLHDKIISDIGFSNLDDWTKQSYFPSYTLDTIKKALSVPFPEVLIITEDMNIMEILSGASEMISQSTVFYLILTTGIGRKDYYNLAADKLIPLILDTFHQLTLLEVYNKNDQDYCNYLFGKISAG